MFNTDLALQRNFEINESKALQFRLESFNIFNHAQFFGPTAVSGDVDNPLFGHVTSRRRHGSCNWLSNSRFDLR